MSEDIRRSVSGSVELKEGVVPTRRSVLDLHQMKRAGEKIAWLTAYDCPTATFEEAAGVDMILVGDSLGMCVYGYAGTVPVTMDQCIVHSEDVRSAAFPEAAHCYYMLDGEHEKSAASAKEDR
jgi:ketopantoate hydroxymethyltransferase